MWRGSRPASGGGRPASPSEIGGGGVWKSPAGFRRVFQGFQAAGLSSGWAARYSALSLSNSSSSSSATMSLDFLMHW